MTKEQSGMIDNADNKDKTTNENDNNNVEKENEEVVKPKGLFRIGGVVFLFAVIGAGYFGAGPIIKFGMEKGLESSIGAETNIGSVDVSWSPFGLTIKTLEQTDPDNLDSNLFQVDHVELLVRPIELLNGITIMDKLIVRNLEFNVPRKTTGNKVETSTDEANETLAEAPSSENADKQDSSVAIPSAESLLDDANLQTEIKARNFQQVWQAEREALKLSYNNLPNNDAVKNYDEQWQQIEASEIKSLDDLKQLQNKISILKEAINTDRKKIKIAKTQYKQSKAQIDLAYKELKAAPGQDWQMIKQKLPIDDPNAMAVSQLLFGEEVTSYIKQGTEFYQKAKPYIDNYLTNKKVKDEDPSNNSGTSYEFELIEPMPTWIVLAAEINISVGGEAWLLKATEVTSESYVRKKDGQFTLNQVSKDASELGATGRFYADKDKPFEIEGKWSMSEEKVENYAISKDSDLALELKDATVHGEGDFRFQKSLTSEHRFSFNDASFFGTGQGEFSELLIDALANINQFDMNVSVSGEVTSPSLKLDSDLDNQVSKAFQTKVSAALKQVENDTKAGLRDKVEQNIAEQAPELLKLKKLETDLEHWESSLKDKAEEKLDSLVADKKQQLEDRIKKEAEDKVKDELEDKLKDKLKGFKCCE